jgi:hypothetical protein
VLEWVEEAVAAESNPYVQHWVLEIAACLALPRLPEKILHLITTEYDSPTRDESGGLFPHVGAIRLAHSATTPEAFEAILNFGLLREGHVLLSTGEAVADVAVALVHSGNAAVIEKLLTAALGEGPGRRRIVAVGALRDLAADGRLEGSHAGPLVRLAEDHSLDPYARRLALEALGFLPKGSVKGVLSAVMEIMKDGQDEELSWRAVEVLARHGLLLEELQKEAWERVGLVHAQSGWVIPEGIPIAGWQAFIIGLLYREDPESFGPALAGVVSRADADAVYQVLYAVTIYGPSTPVVVVDGIVQRIRSKQTRYNAETLLFGVLEKISPTRLVQEPWEAVWDGWHPESRVAFADAVGEVKLPAPEALTRATAMLTALLGDGTFAVRRAAGRSMASLKPQALEDLASTWAADEWVEKRRRAAECLAWLPDGLKNTEMQFLELLADSEVSVRKAAGRALNDRRTRRWSRQYLEKVLSARGTGNECVLAAYRYGRALSRIGDDQDKRRLQQHLASEVLPPHVCHWVSQILKGIDEHWRDVTKKWPEPWMGWEGTVEELDGEVFMTGEASWPAHLSLWRKSQVNPSAVGEWGGAVISNSIPRALGFSLVGDIKITVPGRLPAKGIVTSHGSDGILLIAGSGRYPQG